MDKLLVYESMKDVLNDSTEWGDNCKEGGYYEFVSGVIYMVNNLMKKIDDKTKETDKCQDGRLVNSLEYARYVSDINSSDSNDDNKITAFAEDATKALGYSDKSPTKLEPLIAYV